MITIFFSCDYYPEVEFADHFIYNYFLRIIPSFVVLNLNFIKEIMNMFFN